MSFPSSRTGSLDLPCIPLGGSIAVTVGGWCVRSSLRTERPVPRPAPCSGSTGLADMCPHAQPGWGALSCRTGCVCVVDDVRRLGLLFLKTDVLSGAEIHGVNQLERGVGGVGGGRGQRSELIRAKVLRERDVIQQQQIAHVRLRGGGQRGVCGEAHRARTSRSRTVPQAWGAKTPTQVPCFKAQMTVCLRTPSTTTRT